MSSNFDAVNKVWSGAENVQEIDKTQSFGEILLRNLDTNSDRVMQIDGDTCETLTKAEVRVQAIRCAQNLQKLGCKANDRIGIIARNHQHLTPLLFGAICLGAPITPLDVVLNKDEMSHILRRIQPKLIFCDDDVLESIEQIAADIGLSTKLFTVRGTVKGFDSIDIFLAETGNDDDFVVPKLEDSYSHMALIVCSSGSTGLPKSICLSHALFSYSLANPKEDFPFVTLNFSSFYWFTGIWTALMAANKTTRVFSAKPFSTDLFFDLVEKYKVQFFLGPPCQLQAVVKSERCELADLSSLVICVGVGSYVPTILTQAMNKFMPKCFFITAYGSTEIGLSVTITKPNELNEYPNSVGCVVAGAQVKIINVDTNERCGIDEEGEICVKIPITAMGYYKNDDANRTAFDAEGFFVTGDIGRFNESGRLSITGRKSEQFKNHGYLVSPAELEDIIVKHIAIQEVCVVNVFDDEIASDLPAAVVVLKPQATITETDVYKMISDQLAKHKHLDGGVFFVDKFPMTASGKIARSKIKQIAQNLFRNKQNGHIVQNGH